MALLGGVVAMVATYSADWFSVLHTGWNVGPEVPPDEEIFGFQLLLLIVAICLAMLAGEAAGYTAGAMARRAMGLAMAGRRPAPPR